VVCDYLVLLCYMYSSGLLAGGQQKIQDSTGRGWFCDITYNVCRYEFPYKEYTQFLAFFLPRKH